MTPVSYTHLYTLTVDADGRVTELLFNDYRPGKQNLDLDIYVMERQTLIKLVKDATARGLIYFCLLYTSRCV